MAEITQYKQCVEVNGDQSLALNLVMVPLMKLRAIMAEYYIRLNLFIFN